jgi:hypothetical protein
MAWTLLLLGKCSTTWAMNPASFALVYFSDRVSHFWPEGPLRLQSSHIYLTSS